MATKDSTATQSTFTCLPNSCIGKPPMPIRRKTRVKSAFRRLPFVGNGIKNAPHCWNVPATGGYFGGYETGEAMAYALLKNMREDKTVFPKNDSLRDVAEAFMIRFEQEGGEEMEKRICNEWSDSFNSFLGQRTGFFNTISRFLSAATKVMGSEFDLLSEDELLNRANAGLGFKDKEFTDLCHKIDQANEVTA